MLKRLLLGLIVGAVVGGRGCCGDHLAGLAAHGAMLGTYALAAAVGAAVGLVAGKPIWAKGGGIEAGP